MKFLKNLKKIFAAQEPVKIEIDELLGFWEGAYSKRHGFLMEIEKKEFDNKFFGFVTDLNKLKNTAKINGKLIENEQIIFTKTYKNHKYLSPLTEEIEQWEGEYIVQYRGILEEKNLFRGQWNIEESTFQRMKYLHPEIRKWEPNGFWFAEKTAETISLK